MKANVYDLPRIADVTDAVLGVMIRARQKLTDPINYHRAPWKRIVSVIKLRDYYKCRWCGSRRDLVVHHVKPIERGGTHLPTNLITICDTCHKAHHGPPQKNLQ